MGDLRTIRKSKGLTIDDLSGLLGVRPATIVEVETGKRTPRRQTIQKIESLLGAEVDWRATLSGEDRLHIMLQMVTLLNEQAGGVKERIQFCRQCLQVIEETL